MARHIPEHPKKGSPDAYAWAARMAEIRKKSVRQRVRRMGKQTEKQFFRKGRLKPYGGMELLGVNPRRRKPRRRPTKNPIAVYALGNPSGRISAKIEGVIYNRVIEIRAEKTGYRPGYYKHAFGARSKVCLLALDNGDILVHSKAGVRLWGAD